MWQGLESTRPQLHAVLGLMLAARFGAPAPPRPTTFWPRDWRLGPEASTTSLNATINACDKALDLAGDISLLEAGQWQRAFFLHGTHVTCFGVS